MDEYRSSNRRMWNEFTHINARSALYQLEEFKAGQNKLNPLERGELGDVAGKMLLHLQCHFGMDTLSWAMLGAQVTGVDFSDEAVALARSLSAELHIPGRFICSDIYDLPQVLDETFDIVYTSYGVLCWLSDIPGWAKLAARCLKPGGVFYMAEFHPFANVFDDYAPELRFRYPYFEKQMMEFPVDGSYADPVAKMEPTTSYEWNFRIGEVLTSLLDAGLRLEFVHEHPFTVYQQLPFLERGADGYWHQPGGREDIPLMFSVRATK
jgi:SAM-dependent methyltransferase